jgi:NADP-dependent alcohol dehydrogenase
MALNGLIGQGVPQDWATHMIGHELTALYGIDHARTLAAVLPHLLRVEAGQKGDKLVQFAARVWGITTGTREERIEGGIAATERFFHSLHVPTRLADYQEVAATTPAKVAAQLEAHGMAKLGEHGDITAAVVERILERSLAA